MTQLAKNVFRVNDMNIIICTKLKSKRGEASGIGERDHLVENVTKEKGVDGRQNSRDEGKETDENVKEWQIIEHQILIVKRGMAQQKMCRENK